MTEQTETTEIKMNMRNINVITARSVPDKSVSDDLVMLTMPKMMSDLFMGASIIIIIEHEYHTDARVERESPGE
ncbi:hypothetical protein BSW13_23865 [Salmonella enterica subsp. enterica serovar Enteritidis]|nr:hypothetical protein BSW13_23865 [Salmonella enterica subsp. enterica serovar Enteritidis]